MTQVFEAWKVLLRPVSIIPGVGKNNPEIQMTPKEGENKKMVNVLFILVLLLSHYCWFSGGFMIYESNLSK